MVGKIHRFVDDCPILSGSHDLPWRLDDQHPRAQPTCSAFLRPSPASIKEMQIRGPGDAGHAGLEQKWPWMALVSCSPRRLFVNWNTQLFFAWQHKKDLSSCRMDKKIGIPDLHQSSRTKRERMKSWTLAQRTFLKHTCGVLGYQFVGPSRWVA